MNTEHFQFNFILGLAA